MDKAFYALACIFLLSGSVWLVLRILDWYSKYRAEKFESNRSWFLSELYKLASKCSKIGEFEYAETLNNIIRINSVDIKKKAGGIGLPLSNDALSTDIQLKNRRVEEIKETLNEWIQEY